MQKLIMLIIAFLTLIWWIYLGGFHTLPERQGLLITERLQKEFKEYPDITFKKCVLQKTGNVSDKATEYYVLKGIKKDTFTNTFDTIFIRFTKYETEVHHLDYRKNIDSTQYRDLRITVYNPQRFSNNKWKNLHSWWKKDKISLSGKKFLNTPTSQNTPSPSTKINNELVFNYGLRLRFLPDDYKYYLPNCNEIPLENPLKQTHTWKK